MGLESLWDRIRLQRKPREVVSLDPVEQLAIRALIEYGPRTKESIAIEVNSTRPVTDADIDEALARLVSQGLADSRLQPSDEQSHTLFFSSNKARRLKGHIPIEPRTVTDFYL
jgi:hypothetical protein